MIDPNDKRTLDFIGRDDSPTLPRVEYTPAVVVGDGPLSPAQRQRRTREKRKKLADEQGLKAVWLLGDERELLADALSLFDGVADERTSPEYRHALLQKLKPGASIPAISAGSRIFRSRLASDVADMVRSSYEQALAVANEQIRDLRGQVAEAQAGWPEVQASVSAASLQAEVYRLLLVQRDRQHAELMRAVETLGQRLAGAGLSAQIEPFYWNDNPPKDCRDKCYKST